MKASMTPLLASVACGYCARTFGTQPAGGCPSCGGTHFQAVPSEVVSTSQGQEEEGGPAPFLPPMILGLVLVALALWWPLILPLEVEGSSGPFSRGVVQAAEGLQMALRLAFGVGGAFSLLAGLRAAIPSPFFRSETHEI